MSRRKKDKKAERETPDNVYLSELHRSAFDLAFQLAQAVAAYEMYSSTIKGDHWKAISERGLNRPAAAISGLLRSNSILAITRIWDEDDETNSIYRFLRQVASPVVEKAYGPESERKIFDRARLVELRSQARRVRSNAQFKSLERVRDKRLAHNEVYDPHRPLDPDLRPMALDDEMAVISLTAPILIEVAAMIGCTLTPLVELRQFWFVEAARFWSSLGSAAPDTTAS